MQEQVDALGVKLAQEVQQVDQRASQAIDRPGCDHVDVAAGNGLQQPIEARALVAALGAGDTGVLEELDHAPAVARGDLFKFTSLVFGRLLIRRDPQIDRDALLCRAFFGHGPFLDIWPGILKTYLAVPIDGPVIACPKENPPEVKRRGIAQTGAKGMADNGSVGLLTKSAACSRISPDRPGSKPRKAMKAISMASQ